MKKWIIMLSGLLALQIVVLVGVNLSREAYRAFEPEVKLLSFDAGSVDHIRIDGDADTPRVLKKQEGQWRLPDLNGFPADQGSVKRLLDRLARLEKGWPVATTPGAAKRFKVAEASFERKITLSQSGETQATLYVGTSPGFRKVHVRVPDEDDIHAVAFSAFEAGVKPEDWIDKAILTHKTDDIRRVELPEFTLQRQDDKLMVAGLAEDEEMVEDEARRLLDRIAGLNIRSVLGPEAKPAYGQDEPALRYTVALKAGEVQTYAFSKPKDADHYVLKASHQEEYFKVDTWSVDRIKEVTRDKLVRKKAEDAAEVKEPLKDDGEKQAEAGG